MKKYIRVSWIAVIAATLASGACGSKDSDGTDDLMDLFLLQETVVQPQIQAAQAAAEVLILNLTGLAVPEGSAKSSGDLVLPVPAKKTVGGTKALSCVDGICNGVTACPSSGTYEYSNVALTSSNTLVGTITTANVGITGKITFADCAAAYPKIVNGTLETAGTRTQNGIRELTSSSLVLVSDSSTGKSTITATAETTFTNFSFDGETPFNAQLTYQMESEATTVGKDVAVKVTITYSGTYNGLGIGSTKSLEYSYKLP